MTQKQQMSPATKSAETGHKARMLDSSSQPFQAHSFAEEWFAALPDDVVSPEQFFLPARESTAYWSGARGLMLAVLHDALHTFGRYRTVSTLRGRRLFEEVQRWFESTDDRWLYSFEAICAHLHLDPDAIRRKLWPSRQLDLSPSSQSRSRHKSNTHVHASSAYSEAA